MMVIPLLTRLQPMIKTYRQKISAPGYETKVPEDVRAVNAEKLAAYEAELEATTKAIELFQSMKI